VEITNERVTAAVYEPLVLVEVGQFSEDTLGYGPTGSDALVCLNG
jgi:hypothetical protein